jgi:hypothetical protein
MAVQTESSAGLLGMQSAAMSVSQRGRRKADKKAVQRDRLRVGLMAHQTVALWAALRGGLTAARKADRKALVTA